MIVLNFEFTIFCFISCCQRFRFASSCLVFWCILFILESETRAHTYTHWVNRMNEPSGMPLFCLLFSISLLCVYAKLRLLYQYCCVPFFPTYGSNCSACLPTNAFVWFRKSHIKRSHSQWIYIQAQLIRDRFHQNTAVRNYMAQRYGKMIFAVDRNTLRLTCMRNLRKWCK